MAGPVSGNWSDLENDAIVADYFAMLADDLAGRPYNKAARNRDLQAVIGRSHGSIEYKHQNITAILQAMGEAWIPGYKPAFNVQQSLIDAVVRRLSQRKIPAWVPVRTAGSTGDQVFHDDGPLWFGPPPTVSNRPPPQHLAWMTEIARKYDVAGRDERNRALGEAGEERVLVHERASLTAAGRADLARDIRWVSHLDGDGAGYDIASFDPDGRPRLIEVKTTDGGDRTPFHISRHELDVADANPDEWRLVRLWDFSRRPRAYELAPPLDAHVSLMATSYLAHLL